MGKITVLTAENMTLTTGIRQLVLIQTAAAGSLAARIKVKRVEISQSGSTTLGMIRGSFHTQTGTTTTGTSTTPQPTGPLGSAASGLSGNTNVGGGTGRSGTNLSVNTTPSKTVQHYFNFANLNGYIWKPAPEEEIEIPASTLWGIDFLADPATLTGWTVSVTFEES